MIMGALHRRGLPPGQESAVARERVEPGEARMERFMCHMKRSWAVGVALWAAVGAAAGAGGDIERLEKGKVPRIKASAVPSGEVKPIRVRTLVLEFNPLIPGEVHSPGDAKAAALPLREVGKWNDPIPLAQGYMDDVLESSGGLVRYEIVEWLVVRRFQKKTDGHVYSAQEYVDCLRKKPGCEWHQPDGIDYPGMVEEFGIVPRVESGEVDEVWMMGMPYFGYWESAMAGKGAFYINGGVYEQVPSKRAFAIMGFNIERGVAEMLHDLCHRTESTMARVYGGWKVEELTTNWARFAANERQSKGVAAVGTCHWPPNAESDYDYKNPRTVMSGAEEWLRYPKVGDVLKPVSCETWGGPDYHRNYMKWWFGHLPRAPGMNADGRLNNWWEYVFNYWAYDESGRPVKAER